MFQLGTSYRQKYGFLLNFDPDLPQHDNQNETLPVFRTTSQHRMYHSALNFAAGFFGLPIEGKYHQSILIEHKGFNNSLAPYMSCPNSERPERANAGHRASQIWQESSLIETQKRLNQMVSGIQFSISDMLVNLYSIWSSSDTDFSVVGNEIWFLVIQCNLYVLMSLWHLGPAHSVNCSLQQNGKISRMQTISVSSSCLSLLLSPSSRTRC